MKKVSATTAKATPNPDVETLQKLLGKRTKSIVLINNIDNAQTQSKGSLKGS